ncbi:MAG: hypothetical protein JWO82_3678 [Akkermansiaceae bacterium]|nr:hypothetical protein [Akkermansiaceae bacterium]
MKSKPATFLLALFGSAALAAVPVSPPARVDLPTLRTRIAQLKTQTQELLKRVQLEGEIQALQDEDQRLTDLIAERRKPLDGKEAGKPAHLAGSDPKAGDLPTPDAGKGVTPPPGKPTHGSEVKAPEKPQPPKREQGNVTVKVLEYHRGGVRVEVRALANCDGEVKVLGALPYPRQVRRFNVTPNKEVIQEFSCKSAYSAELTSSAGLVLDQESNLKKSGLEPSKLR